MKLEDIGFYTLSDKRAKFATLASNMKRCEMILTDKCNFKCSYCRGVRPDCRGVMPLKRAKSIIDIWAKDKLENIRFSGGEPTLYPYFKNLIAYAKSQGIKRIAVSTNGSASLNFYKELIRAGVNDYSISLDACCSSTGEKMSGIKRSWEKVTKNIRELSRLTYVTVGMVFTTDNMNEAKQSIEFAHNLGVADIRIISSAQFDKVIKGASLVNKKIKTIHPILKYRINNFDVGRNVRGIKLEDYHRCPLVLDDSVVAGKLHFPCIIYLREQGKPIGEVNKNMRSDRYRWYLEHNSYQDPICQKNCLDVCIDYNNRYCDYHTRIKLPKLDSSYFTWLNWKAGSIHELDIQCRFYDITSERGKQLLKKYAVGWCKSENLLCRPKLGEIALMCFKGEEHFWFHIRKNEFLEVFSRVKLG